MNKYPIIAAVTMLMTLLTACSSQEELPPMQPDAVLDENTTITLYMHETQQIQEISLEEYLYGVVAAEMDVNWPQEALAAQAVLARTYTMEKISIGGVAARGTDASTDINEFQAYDAARINDNVKAAVEETRGKVVTYQGQLIKAWFFADGGGQTAATSVEGLAYDKTETPYIHSVSDPGSSLSDNPNQQWQATFSNSEVQQAIAAVIGREVGQITSVAIAETGPSGRVMKWKFNDDIMVGACAFRLALGADIQKSNLIEQATIEQGQLHMIGSGYGHGVGMSQWGARALAEQGKTYQEIIHYFFQDITIE